jgi:hypothetical protein
MALARGGLTSGSSSLYPQLFPIRPGMAQVYIDKGVAILDLPMILLPNEIINK